MMAENPGIPFGEVAKKLGEKWKSLSAEEKAPFEEKARIDKEKSATLTAAYKASGGGAAAAAAAAPEREDRFMAGSSSEEVEADN